MISKDITFGITRAIAYLLDNPFNSPLFWIVVSGRRNNPFALHCVCTFISDESKRGSSIVTSSPNNACIHHLLFYLIYLPFLFNTNSIAMQDTIGNGSSVRNQVRNMFEHGGQGVPLDHITGELLAIIRITAVLPEPWGICRSTFNHSLKRGPFMHVSQIDVR